jgi:hypothetical protein
MVKMHIASVFFKEPQSTGMTLCKSIEPKKPARHHVTLKEISKACNTHQDSFSCEVLGRNQRTGEFATFSFTAENFEGYARLVRKGVKHWEEAWEYAGIHGTEIETENITPLGDWG